MHLPDDDPLAVRAMIDYIYLGNYDNIMMKHSSNEKPRDVTEFLPLHAKAYVLGDNYELEGLRSTATSKIAETLKADPDSVFTESFWQSSDIVYSYTICNASGIRGCFVGALADHPSYLDTETFNGEVEKHVQLAYELGLELRERFKHPKTLILACKFCSLRLTPEQIASQLSLLMTSYNPFVFSGGGQHSLSVEHE